MDLFAKGWECPKCGAVMSPTTSVCVNCTGITEITITTNVTDNFFSPDDVRNMSPTEVRENYQDIMKSMTKW